MFHMMVIVIGEHLCSHKVKVTPHMTRDGIFLNYLNDASINLVFLDLVVKKKILFYFRKKKEICTIFLSESFHPDYVCLC